MTFAEVLAAHSAEEASSKEASSKEDAHSQNHLQPLLEQAVRESLRELARSAAESSTSSGASRSIECIVRMVAAKVIAEAGHLHAQPEGTRRQQPGEGPQLADLRATPWVLWQESTSDGSSHHSLPPYTQPAFDMELVYERPLRGDNFSSKSSSEGRPEDAEFLTVAEADAMLTLTTPQAAAHRDLCLGSPQGYAHIGSPRMFAGSSRDVPFLVQEGLTVESNSAKSLVMQWQDRPRTVLIIAKPGDPVVMATLQDIVAWLASQGVTTVVEPQLLADQPILKKALKGVRVFSEVDDLAKHLDLVITIGGDGTLTWAVSRFHGPMPPVLSFAAGSLGFLTPFPLDGWVRTLTRLFSTQRVPVPLVCRMRLHVRVRRRTPNGSDPKDFETKEVQCLNEVLVHRGRSGNLAKLDIGVDGEKVTLLQGDGVILATPTGSTAYSLAAGGSMVHPGVPGILLTPVSPHSLSFRPAVLPESSVITIAVPLSARSGATLSVDGKELCMLRLGDAVEVSVSSHPVPTICKATGTADWFASVQGALQWNLGRVEQK